MERGRTVNQLTASCRKVEKGVYLLKTSEAKATAVPGAVKQKLPKKRSFIAFYIYICSAADYIIFFLSLQLNLKIEKFKSNRHPGNLWCGPPLLSFTAERDTHTDVRSQKYDLCTYFYSIPSQRPQG